MRRGLQNTTVPLWCSHANKNKIKCVEDNSCELYFKNKNENRRAAVEEESHLHSSTEKVFAICAL
jgi:hypothetical protein